MNAETPVRVEQGDQVIMEQGDQVVMEQVDQVIRPFWNWSSISLDSGARNIINTTDTSCRGLAGLALP